LATFFHHLQVTEGSGSEILDLHFEDPDPLLIISDPEDWYMLDTPPEGGRECPAGGFVGEGWSLIPTPS